MASYSLEDFVGNGVLKEILPTLIAEGWDDVPTLKMMSAEDMDAHKLTQTQRDALEIRTYLHDRSLMQYADKLEASEKGLPELLNMSPPVLTSQYGMRRGHVARFIDRTSACGIVMPPTLTLPVRKRTGSTVPSVVGGSDYGSYAASVRSSTSRNASPFRPISPDRQSNNSQFSAAPSSNWREGYEAYSSKSDVGVKNLNASYSTKSDIGVKNLNERQNAPPAFKGVVAGVPPEPRMCGLVRPPPIADDVAPITTLEKISVQKITPEYRAGVDPWGYGELKVPPPMKASEIWASRPTLIFCIRRPGCVMCRAEAHQLYARKPIFDALGVQLVAVLNEMIEAEVKSFWPRFWGGMVLVDKNRDFFKALGGGALPTESFITGFLLNPIALANFKRARATGIEMNFNGEGTIKGGLLIVRPGKGGVAYQFVERNFGDWAPMEEVLEICGKFQQKNESAEEEQRSMIR